MKKYQKKLESKLCNSDKKRMPVLVDFQNKASTM